MRANTNLSVKKNNQKAPTNYSSAPKFHSLPSSVNKFAASKPSYMFPAKLHTVSPKDDQFEKTFKKDDKYEFKKDDKKNEKMNNINQTNLQGKKASEPPSGHSYAATGTGFGSGTTTASGSGFGSTTGASGSSTTGTGFGSGSSVSGSGFGSTSGVVGSRGDGGAAGSPSSSASSTGFGGNSTGKQTDSNWPRQTEETPSSGEPWAQSGHSTGTQWSPKSTTDINKDVNAKDYKKDFENKKDEKKLNDPLQTTFTSTSFPEVTSKSSMDSSTQKTAEDSLTKGTKAANDNSGIESRYDRQQFNNTYDYLEKKASETLEDVTSASQKAINFINRTGSSASEGMYTGVTGEKSKDEMDKLKDKGFNTQSSEFDKKAGEKDQSFRTYGTKKENEVGIKTPDAEKNNMNTSNTAKADSKEYENKVKGLEHKDQTFYADTLGDKGKTNIKGDPYLKTTDTTSKDYEHKVKGTHYNEIEEPTVETVSKGDYEARNEKESNKSTYDYMADKAKDIYHDVAEKAKDTYNNLGTNTKHAINDVAEKAKDTYNNMGTSTKNAINNAENKVQHVYNAAETQAKNAAADFQEGQRTYNDSQTGEQKATTDSGIGSMASNIVNKVKETAENVKEKVGNILHSVTGENAKESDIESARSASNQFNNKPYASNTTNDQSINKKFDTKQNSSHRTDHPDNIGHASS